jgi:G3E family GTPase
MEKSLKIPVTVLTGFLGAGKTTLLNRLLQSEALKDTIVIVNEFGEIGLDHLFIETRDDGLILMESGCLCCTIRGDLVDTLSDLIAKRGDGELKSFRRIVIETTGLADPAPILQSLIAHPDIAEFYSVDGVVTLVDAVNGQSTLDNYAEAVKQVAIADAIVLTKSDLAVSTDALRKRLAMLNPAAQIFDGAIGEAQVENVIGIGLFDIEAKSPDIVAWLRAESYSADAPHDHHHHHDNSNGHFHQPGYQQSHDVNRHDEHIRAFCLTSDQPVSPSTFEMFLQLLRSAHGEKLLRMKGIVALSDDLARPVVLHGVQHVFHPPVRLLKWPDGDHRTRMVFITRDLDRSFIDGLWNAFLGRPGIDSADRAAMLDNPLSLRNA